MGRTTKSITLHELAPLWLAEVRISVKESTFTRYNRCVYKYILPYLGGLSVQEIDSFRVNRYTEFMLTSGGLRDGALSPKTVTDVLCVLKAILKFARQNGYACPDISGARTPQRKRKNVAVLPADSRLLLEKIVLHRSDRVCTGILISLFTGLRIGELCGLKWGDVDLRAGTLTVQRTVGRIADLDPDALKRTKVIISEPKTADSNRTIPLPQFLTEALRSVRSAPEHYVLSGAVTPVEPLTFYKRYRRFMHINQLDGYTFHALRHTFATRCIEVGFDTKTLSEILGHANISTTLAIYVHPSMEQKRFCMEKLSPK